MEAIKKSMLEMKKENEKAKDRADAQDELFKVADVKAKKNQEEVDYLNKQLSALEAEYAQLQADLKTANNNLYAKEKALISTEMNRSRRTNAMYELDEKCDKSEKELTAVLEKLTSVLHIGDEANREVKLMEAWAKSEGLRLKQMEKDLKEVTTQCEEADQKIEETCQKMAMVEEEIEFAEGRVANNAMKIAQLEEEVAVVGNNMKSLEVSQEMSRLAEIEFNLTIKNLTNELTKTEGRAQFAEKTVQKLRRDVDRLEDDLRIEHEKLTNISLEMEATIAELK